MQQVYQETTIRRNNSPFTDAFITQQFLSGIVANSSRIDISLFKLYREMNCTIPLEQRF